MTTHRYPPPPLPPPPPPANRQYHVHYSAPTPSSQSNYYSSSHNYMVSQDRRRSSSAREGLHSPIREHKPTFEPYPQHRRRSPSPEPTNSASPPSSDAHSPDMNGHRPNDQKKAVQTAKRAAQNRAAQRAFRQRRERYVKDLEIRVKEMDAMQEEMSKLAEQNMSYRKQVENLTRELKQLKETGGQSFTPYANKHMMTPKSPPPPPPPPPQSISSSPPLHNHRFKPVPKDTNGKQRNGGSFEAEMARRLSHSDKSLNQDSSPYSESLYSLQQRRGLHSPRKQVSAAVPSRNSDYQLPAPATSNPDHHHNNVNTFHHQSNGHSIHETMDRRKTLTSQTTPPGPQVKPMSENGTYMPPTSTSMMDHSYSMPPRSDVGILPSPVYGNEQQRFIHQFGELDNTNPELVGMIDMPPLPMGDGEFEMEDPFAAEDGADDLDFAPEDCDRILDDLVTILQQRNRPQIPHNLNPTEA
ncbi:hypothetical protein K450DRAFT_262022 [Umbelopsis ramanniana AG]|uniref:BZIP domain-containing protein n=1 Tax=Umbelopsis ramanniana AG TaxID=1314678 RepID=A0AAD5E0M2_UMBRA|nr:uncharacterized protein K450DRAFT_262022 [Umbelopsis ramanniana AG]KAI8575391.1 hypothetical protein K450DRAFT_262022 [Umbelopsis ramanniana AG]